MIAVELEDKIFRSIDYMRMMGFSVRFSALHSSVGRDIPFRELDRSLQRLRRSGKLQYSHKWGWLQSVPGSGVSP